MKPIVLTSAILSFAAVAYSIPKSRSEILETRFFGKTGFLAPTFDPKSKYVRYCYFNCG